MHIILKLFVLMSLWCVVQCQCPGLTVYDGNTQIDAGTVCSKVYGTNDCIRFYQSFNQSELPDGFLQSTSSVEKPSDISLKGLDTPDNGIVYPGISFRWNSSISVSARENCFGFLIVWYVENIDDVKCRLLQMEPGNQKMLQYQFNVLKVNQSVQFTARVYSMPPPSGQWKDDERTFQTMKIQTRARYRAGYPAEWGPFIIYKLFNNGTIIVTFSLPPPNYNLTLLNVYLTKKNDLEYPVVHNIYNIENVTEDTTEYTVAISARESDTYYISIWVGDEFRMKPGLCQCWILADNERSCTNSCGGTRTPYFYFNITNPPPIIETTVESTTSNLPAIIETTVESTTSNLPAIQTTISTTESSTSLPSHPGDFDPQGAIIGGVVGVVAMICIIIGIVCFFQRDKKVKALIPHWLCSECLPSFKGDKYGIKSDSSWTNGNKAPKPNSRVVTLTTKTVPELNSTVVPLTTKTVYVMSADDHEAHVELVKTFVAFLEKHCHCKVILPSDNNTRETGAFPWFLTSVEKSDYILFINSEGAEKLIQAHLGNKIYKNRIVGPEGDLFKSGVKHIMCNEEFREKRVILVSFHGEQCKKYIQASELYKLPTHLPHLLQKIHGLNPETAKMYSHELPMYTDNIPELPAGMTMLFAINNVAIYEKDNPNWFEITFGDMKPMYNTSVSTDSGYHPSLSHRDIDSVSQILENSGSPKPGFEEYIPEFPVKVATLDSKNVTHPNCEVTSWFTIQDDHDEKTRQQKQTEIEFDIISFIPPESASRIAYETWSTAFDEINRRNAEPLSHHPQTSPNNNSGLSYQNTEVDEAFQRSLIPPDNPSDILDINSALAHINENSSRILSERFGECQMRHDTDNGYIEADYDSASI